MSTSEMPGVELKGTLDDQTHPSVQSFFKITALCVYPKIPPFKVYNPVVLSVITELRNHPHHHLKHSITPKQTRTLAITPHFSSTAPAPGSH